jgi:hypothetical protein
MRAILALVLLLSWQFSMGQARHRSGPKKTSTVRQDFAIVQNTIWTLSAKGELVAFSSAGLALSRKVQLASSGISLHVATGDSILAHAGGKVILFDTKTLASKTVASLPDSVPLLARDKHRRLWAAGDKGLMQVGTSQTYVPDSTQNHYYKWLPEPSASLLDSFGRLWIGFGMGEWGGNLHVFNTETQRFEYVDFRKSEACLAPVKSFCQVADQVYMSCGVMHFTTFGCITCFDAGHPKPVFISSYEKNYRTINGQHVGEYLGPITYANKELYYYSQNGIFKGVLGTSLAKVEDWKLVFKPLLHWTSGQVDAIGSPINVQKMGFTANGKLVLLAPNDGIGIWDGNSFKLLP